jgi:adenylosuccinate synthase
MNINERVSAAFCGGAYGDEGKGRIVDEQVNKYLKLGKHVIVYRDNGGANADHTLELPDGRRVALHQLPSGVLYPEVMVILGKSMVIHPGDLAVEINEIKEVAGKNGIADIKIDEMASLALDTHRAMENVLKKWQEGGRGATGRGISPAYADILLRQTLRVRDIVNFDEAKVREHYRLYQAMIAGLGANLSEAEVVAYKSDNPVLVGTEDEFIERLKKQAELISPYVTDVHKILEQTWPDPNNAFVFEKAQAIGLDPRFGVYSDVTASDTTFGGILGSTEGIIDPLEIKIRASVLKATYMSSVGTRVLPTKMDETLANIIREDAKEYGATTKRPRGIAYLDLPTLRFFTKVGQVNKLVLTHMDIVYPDLPIKVCTRYTIDDEECGYRPDQEFLSRVTPHYIELPTWDRSEIQRAKKPSNLPKNARHFLDFISDELNAPVAMITTGPKRDQSIVLSEI